MKEFLHFFKYVQFLAPCLVREQFTKDMLEIFPNKNENRSIYWTLALYP